jgi:ribosomal protein L22
MANATTLAKKGIPTTGKTNERPGTRAVVRHVRMSAYKARVVLDLVRNKDVVTADEILKFSERDAAIVVRKLLRSAVAIYRRPFAPRSWPAWNRKVRVGANSPSLCPTIDSVM